MTMETTLQTIKSHEHSNEDYNEDTELDNYIKQLSPLEHSVFEIASEHLSSSFSLRHSIGFIKWSENNSKSNSNSK